MNHPTHRHPHARPPARLIAALFFVAVLIGAWSSPFDGALAQPYLEGAEGLRMTAAAGELALLDIDQDGRPDVIATHPSRDTVEWTRGSEPPGALFETTTRLVPSALAPTLVASADVDGDGDRDLISASSSLPSITANLRDAVDGEFGPPMTLELASGPIDLDAGDVDGDGLDEVLLIDGDRFLRRFIVAEGVWTQLEPALRLENAPRRVVYVAGSQSAPAWWAVLGGEGATELLRVEPAADGALEVSDRVSLDAAGRDLIALPDLSGAAAPRVAVTVGGRVQSFAVNRGAFAAPSTALRAAPGETIVGPLVAAAVGSSIELFVFMDRAGELAVRSAVHASSTWEAGVDQSLAHEVPVAAGAADVDGDDLIDLVIAQEGARTLVALRRVAPSAFAASRRVEVDVPASEIHSYDVDRDGLVDLICRGGREIQVLHGSPEGWVPSPARSLPALPATFPPGSFLGYRESVIVEVPRNDGSGVFLVATAAQAAGSTTEEAVVHTRITAGGDVQTRAEILSPFAAPDPLAAGDFDGDGATDIAVGFEGSESIAMQWSVSGAEIDARFDVFDAGGSATALGALDLDGDSRSDLAVATTTGVRVLSHLDSDVTTMDLAESPLRASALVAGDIDGDGFTDLVAADGSKLWIAYDVADYEGGVSFETESRILALSLQDLDRDGRPEVAALVDGPARLLILRVHDDRRVELVESKHLDARARGFLFVDIDGEGRFSCVVADGTAESISVLSPATPQGLFRRGDVDGNGTPHITDAVRVLGALFLGDGPLACPDAADTDDDGRLSLSDPIGLLTHLFLGGPAPRPPGPTRCGADPTPDALGSCVGQPCD